VGLFGVAAAVAGLGPALVGSSVRTSLGATQAAVAGTSRVVRGAVDLAVGVPGAVARSATAVVGGEPTRRVWSQGGRAQIEVWGLDGAAHSPLTSSRFAALPRSGNSIARQRVPSGHNIGGHDLETDTVLADDIRNGHLETLHCSEYREVPSARWSVT